METIDIIFKYIFLFFIYSFLGWIWETLYEGILTKKFTNRGFLTGPYIPLYGIGGAGGYLVLHKISNNTIIIFFTGLVLATLLEYITAIIIENLFKIRLWNYDNYFLNYKGRICLIATLFWGVIAVITVKYISPYFIKKIENIERDYILIGITALSTIFIIDTISTINSILKLNEKIKNIMEMENKLSIILDKIKDTEFNISEFKINIREAYKHNSKIIQRIIKAFPNAKYKTIKEQNIFNKIKEYNKRPKKHS